MNPALFARRIGTLRVPPWGHGCPESSPRGCTGTPKAHPQSTDTPKAHPQGMGTLRAGPEGAQAAQAPPDLTHQGHGWHRLIPQVPPRPRAHPAGAQKSQEFTHWVMGTTGTPKACPPGGWAPQDHAQVTQDLIHQMHGQHWHPKNSPTRCLRLHGHRPPHTPALGEGPHAATSPALASWLSRASQSATCTSSTPQRRSSSASFTITEVARSPKEANRLAWM